MKKAIMCLGLLISTSLFGATVEGDKGSGDVRVVPVEPTPQGDAVELHLSFPEMGASGQKNPVGIQLRLEGYPIGYDSYLPRCKEIRNSREGQAIRILIDNESFMEINDAINSVTDSEETDFDSILETTIPYHLKPGPHLVRMFLVRSYGESLKARSCYVASYFFVGPGKKEAPFDLSKPYLTYNQPEGEFKVNQPILLDFYISNTQLSKDGYKVRLTIDGKRQAPID
ncbi:MAG: hypothetical protein LVR00_01110 [Rhabdochlamydiaceae bacterium]|jgi:hypothetical protein